MISSRLQNDYLSSKMCPPFNTIFTQPIRPLPLSPLFLNRLENSRGENTLKFILFFLPDTFNALLKSSTYNSRKKYHSCPVIADYEQDKNLSIFACT